MANPNKRFSFIELTKYTAMLLRLTFTSLITIIALNLPAQSLFFAEQPTTSIYTLELSNSDDYSLLQSNQPVVRRLRVDRTNKKVYWVVGQSGFIRRSNLDGSEQEIIYSTFSGLNLIKIDEANDLIYFTEESGDAIKRLSLVTGTVTTLLPTDFAQGIDIAPNLQKIYWTEFNQKRIMRANLDGSNVEIVAFTEGKPFDLLIDTSAQLIYYSERETNSINTINYDGGNFTTILNLENPPGVISIDQNAKLIYWVEPTEAIRSATLEGENIQEIVSGFNQFAGMDVDYDLLTSSHSIELNPIQVNVFPNPTQHSLTVETNVNIEAIELYATDGKTLNIPIQISGNTANVDLHQLPNGTYFLHLFNNEKVTIETIIKND